MAKKINKVSKKTPSKQVVSKPKKSNVIKLKELMDISYAEKFYSEMQSHISSAENNIFFDASDVTRITTPCVQIIISADKEAKENNIQIIFNEISEAFEKAFADLGLQENLNNLRG
ncbi:MAG: STAS domain-containing protein [Rickettsiales bacterium]|nr:STAS domain-containing protein [Rickettsiales bacterium]